MRAMVATRRRAELAGTHPHHVIVIGAARSGTKLLRDALAKATGAGRVPYDISYVWRYGNEDKLDDALGVDSLSENTRRFIRKHVDSYAAGSPLAVIEKTVGNSLRVPAVAAVFPNASYLHLVRDGVDVVESTKRQWSAPTDVSYLARKSLHIPLRLVPRYGVRYWQAATGRRKREDGRVSTWGSRYPGIDADLRDLELLRVCARQWHRSVTSAQSDLSRLNLPVLEVRYEVLVDNPRAELARIANFADLRVSQETLEAAHLDVTPHRRGVGRRSLTSHELAIVDEEIGGLLAELGYESARP